jgi:DNA-directed RNA polymerase beta' subunit
MIFFNRYFDKNRLKALVLWSLTRSGEKTTIDLVEKLKDLGFHYATQAGLSLSIDDLKIPPNKPELILEAEIIVQSSQKDYEIGNLTIIERFQQMIDVWHRTSEVLKQNVVHHFRSTDILNPVYMMAFSGARGNISQVRQLVGMRGLMADPQGQILDFPIRSNFREGLTLTEYVISCYGARKGLVDTALRTANSGYLTRRLVDVAQHILVRQLDCGTDTGILVTDMKDGKKVILSIQKRLVGRVLAESIGTIAYKDQDISPSLAAKIVKLKNQVLVRSPLTCEAKNSVCQLCYGWSLAHGNLVSLGEAVGILAAQSIGEPGTQLTMRTFHTGGVFSGDVMQEIRSPLKGFIRFSSPLQGNLIRTLHGKIAFLTKMEGGFSIFPQTDSKNSTISYQIPNSSILFVKESEKVEEKQLVAEFSSFVTSNNKGIQAKYNLNSEKEGQIYFENVLLVVKGGKEGDIIKTALKFGSIWILAGKLYQSPIRSNLFIKPGDLVDTTSIVNESILATPYSGFLEPFIFKKEKEIFFNKKIEFKENIPSRQIEINFLKQLLNTKKDISQNHKTSKFLKIKKTKNELNLKQPFSTLFIKEINYKKFGYFVSLENLNDLTLFFPNSLVNKSLNINEIAIQIFNKKNRENSGIFEYNPKTIKDQKEQIFLIPEQILKIQAKKENHSSELKKIYTKNFFKTIYIGKNQELIYTKNLQGIKQKIQSKNKNLIFLRADVTENGPKQKGNLKSTKKVFLYKENPSRFLSTPLNTSVLPKDSKDFNNKEKMGSLRNDFKFLLNNKKVHLYKKCLIPGIKSKKEFKNRKPKSLKFLSLNNFPILKERFQNSDHLVPIKTKQIKESFKKLNIQLDYCWIKLPNSDSKFLVSNNMFFRPGDYTNLFYIDQTFSFIKIIQLNENLSFFKKPRFLKKFRYISNKFFRLDQLHKKKDWDEKSFFLKKKKSIVRNQIYLKNFYLTTIFLIITKKIKELNFRARIKKSILLQKFSTNIASLHFYKSNSFLCNKQQITRLKSTVQSLDIQLNNNFITKGSNSLLPNISLFFKFQKNNPLKHAKIEFIFPRNLQFSSIQKINTCNYLVPNHLSNAKLLVTREKAVFQQTNLSFNSFYSPYSGEITSIKTDIFGKQKSLLLTNKDQINFINDKNHSLVKIGQLLRYGDKLFPKIAIDESGQIIQIDKNKITLRKAQPILFSSQGVFHVDNGDLVEKDAPLITLFYQKLKTEDIVQGIPKIEELFEARQTKEGETLQENLHTKLHLFFNYYKTQLSSQEAARKSIEKIQQILVNNVQKVYQSQGVTIADKHIEIIVRQMTTKVKITESGRTGLLRGELIDLEWVEVINLGIEAQNEMVQQGIEVEKAEYEPIILGITKAALETESFISASSFQETTRILSRAAIERKTDFLRGLKENVILGHLIPAGTGFTLSFDPQLKVTHKQQKLSWLNYKDIIKIFSK